ncbi:MAG TPA: carboxypeptidase-like regulatory domain-containing protein, partial [Planctomycetota bacterium]|nr:carboxypeptidase-like regulatory domain-containing protein [Planctomycetota bacterium]
RFELAGLPAGQPLAVEVRQDEFAPLESPPFTASEEQTTDLGELVLDAGLLLIGNVLAEDGRPLAGARIALSELGEAPPSEGGPEPRRASTGADGEYRFDHLAPRQFTVEAAADGFAPRAATLALVFGAATGTARQDFRLRPADAAVGGLVRDEEDRPVPGARLRLSQRDRNAHDYFAADGAADESGRFRFAQVAGGLYQLELLGSSWYLPQPLTVQGGDESLDVRVRSARSVAGRLQGPAGAPRDFRVTVRPDGRTGARLLAGARPTLAVAAADPPGSFVFGGLRPGTYRFEIEAAGYAVTTSADVVLGEEVPTAELLVELALGGTLEGRLVPPAAGIAVELRGADYDPAAPMESVLRTPPIHGLAALTDGQGAFRLEHVPAGFYTLSARTPDRPPLHLRELEVLEGGRHDLGALELPRGGVIFGTVLGADGQPGAGARITALASGQQEQVVADSTGAFRLPPLPPGEYELRATPPAIWEALRFEAQAQVTLREGDETPVLLTLVERAGAPR